LCRELCRNPSIPDGIWLCRSVSLAHKRRAENTRRTCMNTAPLYRLLSLGIAASQSKMRNGMEEVVGSIPTRSTKFLNNGFKVATAQAQRAWLHSGSSISLNVRLCLTDCVSFFLRSGTTRSTGGAPIRSRASSFTICTARSFFTLFFFAIPISPADSARKPAAAFLLFYTSSVSMQ
jgi:hypothetical protein